MLGIPNVIMKLTTTKPKKENRKAKWQSILNSKFKIKVGVVIGEELKEFHMKLGPKLVSLLNWPKWSPSVYQKQNWRNKNNKKDVGGWARLWYIIGTLVNVNSVLPVQQHL
jgi:hypothetical protein